jgi:hypothetical protein
MRGNWVTVRNTFSPNPLGDTPKAEPEPRPDRRNPFPWSKPMIDPATGQPDAFFQTLNARRGTDMPLVPQRRGRGRPRRPVVTRGDLEEKLAKAIRSIYRSL